MNGHILHIVGLVLLTALLCGCAAEKNKAGDSKVICVDEDGSPVAGVNLQFCTDTACSLFTTDMMGVVTCPADAKSSDIKVLSVPDGFEIPDNTYHIKENDLMITIKKGVPSKKITFTTTDLYGNPVDESLFEGYDLVFVNIWEPWCGPCIAEIPELIETYEELKDKNVLFVGITNEVSYPDYDAKEAAEMLEITYPVINYTDDFGFATIDGETYFPTSFFVGKDGNLIYLSDEEVDNLARHMYEKIVKLYEESDDPEAPKQLAKFRKLAETEKFSDEERSVFAGDGVFSVSQMDKEILSEYINMLLERQ